MQRIGWWTIALWLGTVGAPALCRGEQAAGAPAPVAETAALAEQIVVLKAINPLRLTGDQLRALLNVLKPGLEKIEQQDGAHARQIAGVVPQLRAALVQVGVASQALPAELEYRRLEIVRQQSRERARGQLRGEVRTLLEQRVNSEQRAAIIATGQNLSVQQRVREWQAGTRGPLEGMARSLDQLRLADPRRYADARQAFAVRQSGTAQEWQDLQRGRGSSGPGGPAPESSARPPGAGGRGGRPALSAGIQQELRDPAVQERLRPYLLLADQVRHMPEPTYQAQRAQLALQLYQTGEARRAQTNPEQSVDEFIDRVLLSQAAVDALEARLQRVSREG